jgi:hypothetical protein
MPSYDTDHCAGPQDVGQRASARHPRDASGVISRPNSRPLRPAWTTWSRGTPRG